MTRVTYIRGPGKVTYAGATFQTKGDIKVAWHEEVFNIDSDLYGTIDKRSKERIAEITFTPIGSTSDWTATSGGSLIFWPLSNQGNFVGTELFPTTDAPLVITGRDLQTIAFGSAAVSKMPETSHTAVGTLIGQVTFTAIGLDGSLWSTANSMWTAGTVGSWSNPAAPTIVTQPYTVMWPISGSAPWNANIETAAGVKASYEMTVEPWGTDSNGICGYTIKGLTVTARFQPRNLSMAQILALKEGKLQGPGAGRGTSINSGTDLTVTGTGVSLVVKKASLMNPGLDWGSSTARIPELTLDAVLGTPGDPFFILGTNT